MATYKKEFILSGGIGLSADRLFIVSATNSTTISTGSLILSGGAGIAQSLSIGGSLQIFNGSNFTAFKASSSSNNIYTLPNQYPAIGTSVLQSNTSGEMTWAPMLASSSSGNTTQNIAINTAGSANVFHPVLLTPLALSAGSAVSADTTITFNPSTEILYVSGLAITAQTASTNSSSGALIVTGGVGIGGSLFVAGDLTINGTTTTINTVTLTVDDKNIELGSVATPSDVTAEGGGLTLKGATDKSINWYSGTGWSSSESWNLASGNTYKINNTTVLSNNTLGTGVIFSSIQTAGIITSGTWSATAITALYGGTGLVPSFTVGDILYANTSSTWGRLTANSNAGYVLASAGSGATPAYVAQSTLSVGLATTATYAHQSGYAITSGIATTAINLNTVAASTNATHYVLFSPVNGGSGVAVSSDSGLTFNPSSNTVSLSTLAATTVNTSTASVSGSTASTSPSSGALVVTGGVGIGGSVSVGGRLQIFNGANYTAFVSSASGNTVYTLPATSPAIGSSVLQSDSAGVMSWVPMTATSSSSSSGGTVASAIQYQIAGYYAGSGASVAGSPTFTNNTAIGQVQILHTTASTGTSIGALQVAGGVGISGRLSFNQASFGTTGIATIPTMAMIGQTGDPIYMSVLEDNSISFEGSQGQLFSITPNLSTGYIYSVNDITGIPLLRANANANVTANEYAGNFGIGLANPGYKLHVLGSVGFTSTTVSTSATTGTLVVSGGVGIGQSLSIGGYLQIFNGANYTSFVSSASGNTVYTLPATSPATGASVLQSTSSGVLSWVPMTAASASGNTSQNIFINNAGNANIFHPVLFTPLQSSSGSAISSDSTISFNPSSEILYVSGLAVTSVTASTSSTLGALVVSGGVGIGGSLYVASATGISGVTINNGVVTGNLTGTATTATYAHQAGYAITSGSASIATTATYAHQAGYAITSGSASIATTATYAHQAGYAITSGSASIATTATYAHQAGYAITSGSASIATTAFNISLQNGVNNTSHSLIFSPIASGSGIALSTNQTVTYNPFTSLLSVSGVAVTSGTNSVSSITGAVIVTGGVGIGSSVSVGGRLQLFNSSSYTAFVSSATGNTVYTLPATSPAVGSSVLQSTSAGVLSWVPLVASAAAGNTSQNIFVNAAGAADVFHQVLFTPAQQSAGSAVSSDVLLSFNASSDRLFASGISITSGAASTNPFTGALQVTGGLGVSGQATFARASLGFTGVSVTPIMSFIGATTGPIISLSVLNDNSLSFEGSSGQLFAIDNNLSTGEIFSVSDISGLPIISASAGQTVAINEFGGVTRIGDGTYNAVSATNAGLVVIGGFGVTGNAFIGGTTTITSVSNSTAPSNGALLISGGVGIGQSVSIGGRLQLFNSSNYTAFVSSATGNTVYTLPATSPAIGSSVLQSTAAGVMSWVPMVASSSSGNTSQNIVVNTAGNANVFHPILFTPLSSSSGSAVSSDSTISFNSSTEILNVSGLAVTSTTASTSSGTGALIVTGGVGIGGSLYVASATAISGVLINNGIITGNLTGTASFATTATYAHQSGYAITSGSASFANTATYAHQSGYAITSGSASFANTATYAHQSGYAITSGSSNISGFATTAANINLVNASTDSAHPILFSPLSSGSGVAVSSDLTVSYNPSTNILSTSGLAVTANTASTNSSSGALIVSGGVGIGGSLYVAGNLTINGTTTTINTVTLTVDDKNIELGSVTSPSDATAEGGGITLRGSTDKILSWYAGTGWSSNQPWNLSSGNTYKINSADVLSNSSLGTGVTNSSLTALGTITTGVWSGTSITAFYGGTGLQTTFTVGDILYANTSSTWARLTANSNSGYVLTSAGSGVTPTYVAQSTLSVGNATSSGIAITATNINVVLASTNASHPLLFTPTSGSASGLAVSSNSTLVYNPSTDILSVSGLAVTSSTASTTTTTGSLIITGGVGIGQSASVGGRLQLFNGANYTAFVSSASGNTVYTLPASSPATGSSVLQSTSAGVMSWVSSSSFGASSGGVLDGSVQYKSGSGFGGTRSFLFNTTNYGLRLGEFPNEEITNGNSAALLIEQAIGSFNGSVNGTLIAVNAKTGFAGDLINLQLNAITQFKVFASGAIGMSGGISAGGDVRFTSNSASTSSSSGALTVTGGVGIGGSLYTSSSTANSISGVVLNNGVVTSGNWSATAITSYYGGTGYQSFATGDLLVGAGATLYKLPLGTNNFTLVADSTAPGGVKWTSVSGLAITNVNGITASKQDLAFGYSGTVPSFSSSGSTHTLNIPIAGTGATGLVSSQAQSLSGIKTFTNAVVITDNTASTTVSTGALTVTGGVGIQGELHTVSLVINGTYDVIGSSITLPTAGAGQSIYSLSASVYRSVKFMVQVTRGSDYQVQEILLLQDGIDAYLTQYAQLLSGNDLILSTYDADLNGGNMRLLVSPTYTNTTYKIYGTAVRL